MVNHLPKSGHRIVSASGLSQKVQSFSKGAIIFQKRYANCTSLQ